MVHEAKPLVVFLALRFLQSRVFDRLGTRLGLLMVDVRVDQLKVAVVLGDPGGRVAVRGRARVGGRCVWARVGVVENQRSMTMDRRLADAVAAARWDGVGVVAAVVTTSTVGCVFTLGVNRKGARQAVGCRGRTPRGAVGRRGNRGGLLVFGAIDLACLLLMVHQESVCGICILGWAGTQTYLLVG